MGKYRCVFRNCNTMDAPGKGVMPPACAAKKCKGTFSKRPECKTFMQDALPPEPIIELGRITPIENPFSRGMHFGILIPCKRFPSRAVIQA